MSITVLPLKMRRRLPAITMKNYTYLVFDPAVGEALVVDPAWEMEKIDYALHEHRLRLTSILVTHGHSDHVDLVHPLVKKHGCEVWMSREDIAAFSFESANLRAISSEAPFQAAHLTVRPWHTPGHTMGCICYLIEDNFFTGDTLFIEGCGMCWGKNSDPVVLFDTLQKLKTGLRPETRIYPGHSYGFEPGKEFSFVRDHNLYLHFRDQESFVAYRMRKGQTRLFDFK